MNVEEMNSSKYLKNNLFKFYDSCTKLPYSIVYWSSTSDCKMEKNLRENEIVHRLK